MIRKRIDLEATLDPSVNALYIKFAGPGANGVHRTVAAIPDSIYLDFDVHNRLIGIEFLDAKSTLPAQFLDNLNRV